MKPKFTLLIALVCLAGAAYSSDKDSVAVKRKIAHHVQFIAGNYVGQSFLPEFSPPVFWQNARQRQIDFLNNGLSKPTLLPMFSFNLGFDYKVDFTPNIGLRTGLNFFTYGYTEKGTLPPACPECFEPFIVEGKHQETVFQQSLLIPVQLLVFKNVGRGRFIFTAGPDFYLPADNIGAGSFTSYSGDYAYNWKIRYRYKGLDFLRDGSMGFTTGFGYEKKLSENLAVELSPDIYFLNLVPFDFEHQGLKIYQNYVFNAAFGLSIYTTFY